MDGNTGESVGVGAGFAVVAILGAAALVPLREEVGNANVAMALVLVVVAAATLGGRVAGATTAVAAALSFNFFHTKPYLTLRIHAGRDIVTVALILAVGIAVGQLGASRSRQSATRSSHLRSMRALEQVGALVTAGASTDEVWTATHHALMSTLDLTSARFEAGEIGTPLPVIGRDGRLDVKDRVYLGDGFALPVTGAAVLVEADGVRLGRLVLVGDPTIGVTREQRRTAVAIADQFALAMRRESRQSLS